MTQSRSLGIPEREDTLGLLLDSAQRDERSESTAEADIVPSLSIMNVTKLQNKIQEKSKQFTRLKQ
tara:strand:+ start:608 stop:805 length:198 start_codon:yes stop_codon:yes gene_type:complete